MKKIITALGLLLTLQTLPASAIIIDFNNYGINSYSVQDETGTALVSPSGSSLELTGNIWKSISLNYVVTSNTLLNFEFFSDIEGEIQSIGFDNNNVLSSPFTFQLFGVQSNFGVQTFNTYEVVQGWKSFNIDVGSFYTGSFDRLFFTNDHDVPSPTSTSLFRNVEICESGSCFGFSTPSISVVANSPGTLLLFSLSFIFIGLRRRL
jgi:hypothetical protein